MLRIAGPLLVPLLTATLVAADPGGGLTGFTAESARAAAAALAPLAGGAR